MSNNEYREAQQQAREHGLKARHEQRLESATYTAAEVKVLTEAALRLGRKEVGEEIAVALELEAHRHSVATAAVVLEAVAAPLARQIASQPSPDATSGRTDPAVDSDLPQDSQAGRKRCPQCGFYSPSSGLEHHPACPQAAREAL